ncbi:adenosylmethionine-8-amino-7-oxononanoate aminotransferase [Canicola haemoglobinophilus]|uniref:Adenosylmethionine-8-amino-7-oxononanoate aminotransferase n=1 Tax=Canicola haemoglobinophilus TaxID=733 RepID=A0AB38H627_9PAST|nr:adenosylmethionine-8-amino-7-oxononanoate aminotransferase [Canicola haemoglobinophilus]STO67585.1 adenosylmethionine-8-amino-7-oxononanoate aminotransferase [Canicola haemoglobinophilus]
MNEQALLELDKQHIWHPYAAINSDMPMFAVERAEGVESTLKNGRTLIDGMSS